MRGADIVARAVPDAFAFPFHRVAITGNERFPRIYDVKLDRPMSPSSYQTGFETARDKVFPHPERAKSSASARTRARRQVAGSRFRFYDARHTFVTQLAENPAVSEETIRQLAGHVSPRYAHIRAQARRDAIATLERPVAASGADFEGESPQNSPQSDGEAKPMLN